MEGEGIEMVKQRVDRLCQTDDRTRAPIPAGIRTLMSKWLIPSTKGGVKPQRHQQRGKAHSGRDQTQGQTEPGTDTQKKLGVISTEVI